jgi:hypothetical protein
MAQRRIHQGTSVTTPEYPAGKGWSATAKIEAVRRSTVRHAVRAGVENPSIDGLPAGHFSSGNVTFVSDCSPVPFDGTVKAVPKKGWFVEDPRKGMTLWDGDTKTEK